MVIKRRKENGFLLFDLPFFAQHSAAIRQSKKRVTQKRRITSETDYFHSLFWRGLVRVFSLLFHSFTEKGAEQKEPKRAGTQEDSVSEPSFLLLKPTWYWPSLCFGTWVREIFVGHPVVEIEPLLKL